MNATQWHVRFNVANTMKEGWRVSEITVSADYDEENAPESADFERNVRGIYQTATAFCQEQNVARHQLDRLTTS